MQRFDAGEEIYLACHLYLGLGNSTRQDIKWWLNSSRLDRNIQVQDGDGVLFDVIKESRLIIPTATFGDAGTYQCSTTENGKVVKSQEVTVKVLTRKYNV